jgi:hypothetical protein
MAVPDDAHAGLTACGWSFVQSVDDTPISRQLATRADRTRRPGYDERVTLRETAARRAPETAAPPCDRHMVARLFA